MRPQQNRRMRGRGGNNNNNNQNRKSPNPLTRSYESNGPDVKIRGTAQQVAEKYTTLWRDAQSSGDRVMAENYLQHAEHYNRLIAAAMLVQNQQVRSRDDDDEDRDDQDDGQARDDQPRNDQPRGDQGGRGSGPQPVIEGMPAEVAHEQDGIGDRKPARSKPAGEARMNGADGHQQQASESDDEESQAPRRARRPRRPRAKAGEGEAESGGAEAQSKGEMAETVND